ncbi:MAG: ArsR/SmtB family transcription factor, partial [Burkholderiales bacterium]
MIDSAVSTDLLKGALYQSIARVAQALANGNRLQLLELIAQGERSVDALAALTRMTVANTSQHLQALRQAGLVAGRKDGQR